MTLATVTTTDAEHLFTVIRDSDFHWTVDELPPTISALGWTIAEEIPGTGAVADTPWGIPTADAELLYNGTTVESMTIRVTDSASEDDPTQQLAIIDAFATLVATATRVLGPPTGSIPDEVPRVSWRNDAFTVTIQNVGVCVLVIWARTAHQDLLDDSGMI